MFKERLLRSFQRGSESECWPWTGTRHSKLGYGLIWIYGLRRQIKAHRFMFMLRYGPIPKGMFICHKCDNPPCVNPRHLFIGTCADNMRDMREKGRSTKGKPRPYNRGIENGNCNLTEEDVEGIKALRHEGWTLKDVGNIYGCCENTVRRISLGITHGE